MIPKAPTPSDQKPCMVEWPTMPSRQELERTNPKILAVHCQRVADNPGAYLATGVEEASKLKLEWEQLQAPPNLNLAVERKLEQKKEELRQRMVELLDLIL